MKYLSLLIILVFIMSNLPILLAFVLEEPKTAKINNLRVRKNHSNIYSKQQVDNEFKKLSKES